MVGFFVAGLDVGFPVRGLPQPVLCAGGAFEDLLLELLADLLLLLLELLLETCPLFHEDGRHPMEIGL